MKKKKISREARIGMFGIAMILLLYLGINYIKSRDIFSRDNTYYAVYDNSDGIEASSPVTIKGFRVGTVEQVWYDVESGKVITEFSVKRDYPIPVDSKAKITSASLMGAKVIDLQLGSEKSLLADGDTIPSLMEQGILQMVNTEYDQIKEMATTLVARISKALDGINAVLSDENVANLSGLLAHANSISGNLDAVVAGDLRQTMADLNRLSSQLAEAAPHMAGIVDRVEGMADTLSVSLPTLLNDATTAVKRLDDALAAVNRAEGSAGKLIYDRQLYDNLTQASNELTLLLQDMKANPGRYIHFSVFGRKND
ncbi:MlaD family protein [uncultured Rikenella sp.]|mgnify:FL=1|uniref:MlaD family protein n=1 Tax=uncultured Rikenella sp. TaxID=368003 RepID=UPI0025FBF2C1|nr:MlaD family protein [uncultured Rikenella sp.]